MHLLLEITGTPMPADDLDAIAAVLDGDPDLRGCEIERSVAPPPEGALGSLTDALTIALGSGGAAVALVQALGGWLNARGSDATITVKNRRSTVTITLQNVRDPQLYRQLLSDARDLSHDDPPS